MKFTLSSSRSRSDPLSPAKVRLSPTLTLSPFMIWYSGQTALFLLLLARAAPAYLPSALSVASKSLFPFQQAQYAQVFLPKPAPFCTLFTSLGSIIKSATSLVLLSDSRSFLTSIFPSTPNSLAGTVFSMRLQGVPGHSFLPGNDAADELARRGALLVRFAISWSLSSYLELESYFLV